jgi:ribose 5-phosphate isomerase B
MKIGVGADHRGFYLKTAIVDFLKRQGCEVNDYGAHSNNSVDYPRIALALAQDVSKRKVRFGILSCYTGQGMAMTANKVKGIRAAVCLNPETARLSRAHNNANILVIPGSLQFNKKMQEVIGVFLNTKFDRGRHLRRINIIKRYEKDHL